jgi:WD40 repeat protein
MSETKTRRVVAQLVALVGRERLAEDYDAFISYSHAADGQLASALQRALQRFARPLHRLRALRIFRDDESLAASDNLGREIEDALSRSRFLILLASPAAAASPWVELEVAWWRAAKPVDRLLICLTAGTIAWDADSGDFDWRRTTALPRVLSRAFPAEPRYARLDRVPRTSTMLSLGNTAFRDAVRDLASPIHDVPKDALESEDVLQRRRTTRVARVALALLVVLTVLSGLGACVAMRERDAARRQAAIAVSRSLAASAMALRDDEPDRGRGLALKALRASRTPEAEAAFAATAFRAGLRRQIGTRGRMRTIAVHPQAGLVATADRSGIHVRDATSGRVLRRLSEPLAWNWIRSGAFSADAKHLVAFGPYSEIAHWNVRTGQRVTFFRPPGEPERVAISPDGSLLVTVGGAGGRAAMWRAGSGELLHDLGVGGYRAIRFSPDGRFVALADYVRPRVVVLSLASGQRVADLRAPMAGVAGAGVDDVAFAPDGRHLAVALDFGVAVWSGRRWNHMQRLAGFESLERFATVSFSADGRFLIAGGDDQTARIWKWPSGRAVAVLRGHSGPVLDAAIDTAAGLAATASYDGTTRLWSLRTGAPLATYSVGPGPLDRVWFDRDGYILTVGADDVTRVWGVPVILFRGHVGAVRAAIFTEDESSVVSAGDDGTGRVWSLAERRQIGQIGPFPVGDDGVSTSFRGIVTSTSRIVLLEGNDSVAWDPISGRASRPTRQLGGDAVISRDGRFVSQLDFNGRLNVWRTRDGTIARTFAVGDVTEIRLSPSGDVFAADPVSSTLAVWDSKRGRVLRRLPAAGGGFARSSFDPSGKLLAVAEFESSSPRGYGWRAFVRLWDWRAGKLERTLEAGIGPLVNHPPVFDASGEHLLVISGNAVYVWETSNGRLAARFASQTGMVHVAQFSANGRYIVTVGADGAARVFDLATASEIVVLRDHRGGVTDARFSRHDRWLVTAGADGEIHVYACTLCSSPELRRSGP